MKFMSSTHFTSYFISFKVFVGLYSEDAIDEDDLYSKPFPGQSLIEIISNEEIFVM
jgi:hypothetical protein